MKPLMKKIIFSKEDVFELENEELKYILKWIIPNAQKKYNGAYTCRIRA